MTTYAINKDPLSQIGPKYTPESLYAMPPGSIVEVANKEEMNYVARIMNAKATQEAKDKPTYDGLLIRRLPVSGYTVHKPSGDILAAFGNLFDATAFVHRSM